MSKGLPILMTLTILELEPVKGTVTKIAPVQVISRPVLYEVTFNYFTMEYMIRRNRTRVFSIEYEFFNHLYAKSPEMRTLVEVKALLWWYLKTYERIDVRQSLVEGSVAVVVSKVNRVKHL